MTDKIYKISSLRVTCIPMSDEKRGVFLPLPLPAQHVFRYQAADDVLELLYRNPHQEFRITELRETTGHGGKSVDNAVTILANLNLIQKQKEGRESRIQINQEQIQKPDDPILEIPQDQFRGPVKAFSEKVQQDQEDNLVGILLFGSVARGEADRASDIDIQVIVENDLLHSRRSIQDIRQQIEQTRFDGDRFELQVMVESIETAEQYGERLQEIFSEAITLYSTDQLEDLREVILNG